MQPYRDASKPNRVLPGTLRGAAATCLAGAAEPVARWARSGGWEAAERAQAAGCGAWDDVLPPRDGHGGLHTACRPLRRCSSRVETSAIRVTEFASRPDPRRVQDDFSWFSSREPRGSSHDSSISDKRTLAPEKCEQPVNRGVDVVEQRSEQRRSARSARGSRPRRAGTHQGLSGTRITAEHVGEVHVDRSTAKDHRGNSADRVVQDMSANRTRPASSSLVATDRASGWITIIGRRNCGAVKAHARDAPEDGAFPSNGRVTMATVRMPSRERSRPRRSRAGSRPRHARVDEDHVGTLRRSETSSALLDEARPTSGLAPRTEPTRRARTDLPSTWRGWIRAPCRSPPVDGDEVTSASPLRQAIDCVAARATDADDLDEGGAASSVARC
jgi:hypothetical protein